jgi:hypothetical protein
MNMCLHVCIAAQHRGEDGRILKAKMERLECNSRMRIYVPWAEYRHACPKMLVVCWNEHTHPIPLPTKTPPSIRQEILLLLESLQNDLPDLTPRRFIRHPTTNAYLRNRLPLIRNPVLSDLHTSLTNLDHLRAYILQVQAKCFPCGTGWDGNSFPLSF